MEPISNISLSYAVSKLWLAVGGSFGSGALGAIWRPAALDGYGSMTRGVIIGGIGAGAPVMLGGFIATQLGLDPRSADVGMAIGTVVGLCSVGFIVFAANFFKRREDKDVLEIVQEVRSVTAPKPKQVKQAPTKRPTRTSAK